MIIASLLMLGIKACMMGFGVIEMYRNTKNDTWETYEKKGKKYWRRKQ